MRNQTLMELADDIGIAWEELNTPEARDRLHAAIEIGFEREDGSDGIATGIVIGYGLDHDVIGDCPDTREYLFKTYDRETIRRYLDELCEIVDDAGLAILRKTADTPVSLEEAIAFRQVAIFDGDGDAYQATLANVHDGLMSAGAIACWYGATTGGLTDEGRKLLAYLEKSQS